MVIVVVCEQFGGECCVEVDDCVDYFDYQEVCWCFLCEQYDLGQWEYCDYVEQGEVGEWGEGVECDGVVFFVDCFQYWCGFEFVGFEQVYEFGCYY